MVDIKKHSMKLVAIAGLLVILSLLLPTFFYYSAGSNRAYMWWLFGAYIRTENGQVDISRMVDDTQFIAIGTIYFIIFLIIGIFLVLSALMTMKGKDIPHKGLLWKIFGALLILAPFLIRLSIVQTEYVALFAYYNLILLFFPIAGTLTLVPEILNKTGDRKNG